MRTILAIIFCALAASACSGHVPSAYACDSWHVVFDGYGHVWHRHGQFTLEPARPRSPAQTHAALVLSGRDLRDFSLLVRLRTNRQLRRPNPNNWEVGWLLWHYQNDRHFYYLILKPAGWELGKEDPRYPGNQHFLATGRYPVFPTRHWYTARITQNGSDIGVHVDGRRLLTFTDGRNPYLSGRIGLYVEDASATYRPVIACRPG